VKEDNENRSRQVLSN